MTKSALPERSAATISPIALGSSAPSPSMKTRMSTVVAAATPARHAPPSPEATAPQPEANSNTSAAGTARYRGRAVGRAAVSDDNLVDDLTLQRCDYRTDGFGLIQSRNHDRYFSTGRRSDQVARAV